MNIFIIISSLIFTIVVYFIMSIKERSFLNIFTPIFLIFVPANYILELIHIFYFGYSGSITAYLFCYLTYALSFISFACSYFMFPIYKVNLPFTGESRNHNCLPYAIIALSLFVYFPILIEYREFILSPRDIYIHTRTGYGLSYFLSSTLAYIAFILFLLKRSAYRGEIYFAFIICTLILLLHGSKGQLVSVFFIIALYGVYIKDYTVSFKMFMLYGFSFAAGIVLLFIFTLPVSMKDDLLKGISSYSDYTRNAMMVIDSEEVPLWGKLTFEETIYSRIPRAIYPGKPKDFGSFHLAKKFYPEWFKGDTGSPSFGIGVQYADFGLFSIFYILFWSVLTGILLKIFMTRLRIYKDPSDFIIVLFFSGVNLIPLGAGYLLPEHFFLAFAVAILLKLRFSPRNPLAEGMSR